MNGKIITGIVVAVLVLGGIGYMAYAKNAPVTTEATAIGPSTVTPSTVAVVATSSDEVMTSDHASSTGEVMTKEKGAYIPYSADKIALASKGPVVLFFHASWCPTCRALDADIKAHLDSIPTGVTILDVDYDTSTALKQKYGVTMQHTLVQVDAQGSLITKWAGSPTLALLTPHIKQ
jgi:thioredoxin 1